MGRAPCCDKANVKKGPWSPEEDTTLKSYIEQNGTGGNWIALPQKIGLKRCGKSCRLRWLNYLRPNIKHGGFSEEEDNIICSLYVSIGSRWSIIAAQLPGRTDNDIKNYWNTRLKKKLLGKQRKAHQQARRVCGVKEEIKRVEDENLIMDGNRNTYWPEPPPVVVYPSHQVDRSRVNDDHGSIRKLLVKLGGRFSSDDGLDDRIPLIGSSLMPPQHFYDNSVNLMAPSASTNPLIEGSPLTSGHMLQVPNGFPMELDEMFYCNPIKMEGLDCFHGVENMVNESNGTSTPDSMNWSEVSTLIYPSLVSSYQGMQHQGLFEEPVHLGVQ